MCVPRERQEGRIIMAIKFCTKCGKKFESVGREVICPSCKQAAAEESKKAAVLRAKKASWAGESVPVRVSGRASAVIRKYGAANNKPFAEALDELLKASAFFKSTGKTWEEVEPYKSRRRDKSTTETAGKQDAPQTAQAAQDKPQDKPQGKPQAANKAVKTTAKKATKTVKTAGKKVEKC